MSDGILLRQRDEAVRQNEALRARVDHYMDLCAKLSEENEGLRDRVGELVRERDGCLEGAGRLSIRADVAENRCKVAEARANALAEKNAHLDEGVGLLRDRIAELEATLARAREVIERLLKYETACAAFRGLRDCSCMGHSRDREREYETGQCPHQKARDFLTETGNADHG